MTTEVVTPHQAEGLIDQRGASVSVLDDVRARLSSRRTEVEKLLERALVDRALAAERVASARTELRDLERSLAGIERVRRPRKKQA